MDIETILNAVRKGGGDLVLSHGGLSYLGPAAPLTPELRQAIAAHRAQLVDLVAGPEVAWRARAMRRQIQSGKPIPMLTARPTPTTARSGQCLSCGEPVTRLDSARCEPCIAAAEIALNEHQRARNGESRG